MIVIIIILTVIIIVIKIMLIIVILMILIVLELVLLTTGIAEKHLCGVVECPLVLVIVIKLWICNL